MNHKVSKQLVQYQYLDILPGTMTEAKACHTRVSKAARATFPESESGI